MSNLLKIGSFKVPLHNLDNYKKTTINVIIICLMMLLFGCEASEKAEKERLRMTFKTVCLIPSSNEDSDFFQIPYDKQSPPTYPW
jgi:hypothetical protein